MIIIMIIMHMIIIIIIRRNTTMILYGGIYIYTCILMHAIQLYYTTLYYIMTYHNSIQHRTIHTHTGCVTKYAQYALRSVSESRGGRSHGSTHVLGLLYNGKTCFSCPKATESCGSVYVNKQS